MPWDALRVHSLSRRKCVGCWFATWQEPLASHADLVATCCIWKWSLFTEYPGSYFPHRIVGGTVGVWLHYKPVSEAILEEILMLEPSVLKQGGFWSRMIGRLGSSTAFWVTMLSARIMTSQKLQNALEGSQRCPLILWSKILELQNAPSEGLTLRL